MAIGPGVENMVDGQIDWIAAQGSSESLAVHLLGLTDQPAALWLQEQYWKQLAVRHDRCGALFLCEHPLTLTIGREGAADDILVNSDELRQIGVKTVWHRRGGGAWVHHPGQIVAYLVMPVGRCGLSTSQYVSALQHAAEQVGRDMHVLPRPTGDRPGATGRCGQYAFVGASVREGVTQFGMCLNVSLPRHILRLVKWNGGPGASSVSEERMRPVSMATARESLIRHLAAELGYERYHLMTGHPALRREPRRWDLTSEPAYSR
jgi:lipoyl(octanoyl) transferase